MQTPQIYEEEKTGPHRHKQVPLLSLHVCCGGDGGGKEEVVEKRINSKGGKEVQEGKEEELGNDEERI